MNTRFHNDMQRISIAEATSKRASPSGTSPAPMKKSIVNGKENDNEDDYSASVCAIMQQRNSTRRQSRRKRRPSSPFGVDNVDGVARRRSSVYTTSSGDTVITMEESSNQEQIFENVSVHKEVLSAIKQQPWPLRRKIKLIRQAKAYIRRHEGVLQERLAQSRNTKDIIARVSLFMTKKWQYFRRELINLQTWLIPWEVRIMEIESHFGSAVASYFIFLRWLFWINLVMATTLTAFVAIPEVLTANATLAGERKIMLQEEAVKSKDLLTLWEFEGVLKYSPFFYGWYTNQDSNSNYRLPLAYFVTNLVVYIYSFVAILRKMAKNSRLSKLTEKEDEYVFSWKLFTGWDFMIGNPETAHNRTASIMVGFKEALLEEAEKQKDKRNWRIISMKIFVNVAVLSLLALSAYAVIKVVERSIVESQNWWRQNEITIVMSLITYLFPILFEILGFLESYHPRKQLRIQLARIMVLNLLNLYSLIFALFHKIRSMKQDVLYDLKPINKCVHKLAPCDELTRTQQIATLASLCLVLINNITHSRVKKEISQSMLPSIKQEPFFLNPLLDNDTLYKDFNDTYDYKDYSDYDNYQSKTLDMDNSNESSITSYYEEQYTESVDDNEIHYNASPTVISNFLTDSTITRHFYTSSTLSQSETTASTLESNIMEGTITTPSTSDSKTSSVSKFNITSTVANTTTITTHIPESQSPTLQSSDKHVIPLPKDNCVDRCLEKICTTKNLGIRLEQLNLETRKRLRRSCWETMFGQELAKLTVMDLILTILATLSMDFFRAVFVRFMNNFWCWDLEKQFPQYGDFKIAENILHLVNNQGMVWMGMFFSPGLTALNLFKLGVLMYLRSWAVLTCNVPHEVVFRASRSNNFYFALLLTMLFLCVLPVGYAIVWVEPSCYCGPFSGYPKIYNLATQSLTNSLPKIIQQVLDYVASPGIVIPLIVLMTLIIYYMASLTGSLREANNDLKMQLRQERTEERRKLFKIAEKRHTVAETPLSKWKKILPALPQVKISQNSETVQKANVQISIGNVSTVEIGTVENKDLMNDTEEYSRQDQVLSNCDNEQRVEEQNGLISNDTSSNRSKLTNVVGCSWDSSSNKQSVTVPEIQVNNEEKIVSDVCANIELDGVPENGNQETT
ncbi:PREDICTED: transmembrane channel-like protein 3 [Trachymyrmex septentrionalis]|uniref:transmembrane channel-like protein 3 n=1 Tax=Trachymyrmex septentrionalis TaxID=34720 RepID=UPI00084F2159|nr:PREDICTED: transmembrane channel-like protein 3 [Trachymyrmex septentrionalis]